MRVGHGVFLGLRRDVNRAKGKATGAGRYALRRALWMVGIGAVIVVAGCTKTTRIDDEAFSLFQLKQENRGIVLMRVGAASHKCVHVAVLLGVKFGEAYRRSKVLGVANVRSIADAPVAEAELDAGEYHVLGYSCSGDKGARIVADDTGAGSALFKTSFARFTIGRGDVLNVGYLHFAAEGSGDGSFGRGIKASVTVTDWPLAEIARFEHQRPHLFAQMTTRLMETGDPQLSTAQMADVCATWRHLAASGKAATVPDGCQARAGSPDKGRGAVTVQAPSQAALR